MGETLPVRLRRALNNDTVRNQILGFSIIILVWELYGWYSNDLIMVPFSEVARRFLLLYTSDVIYDQLIASMQQFAIGYILAVFVALVVGISMGASDTIEYLLDSYTNFLFVTSVSSMLPLLIIFFGTGLQFRVAVVFLYSVFHMIFNFKAGVEDVNRDLVDTSRVFGASGFQVYRHVIVPASLPFLIAGLRLGIGRSWKGMVIAELWIVSGIGSLLKAYQRTMELDALMVVVLTLMAFGVGSVKLLYWVQHRVAPWGSEQSS